MLLLLIYHLRENILLYTNHMSILCLQTLQHFMSFLYCLFSFSSSFSCHILFHLISSKAFSLHFTPNPKHYCFISLQIESMEEAFTCTQGPLVAMFVAMLVAMPLVAMPLMASPRVSWSASRRPPRHRRARSTRRVRGGRH